MTGESILRGAWLNWKIKKALTQLINAGFERFLLGIPVLTIPKTVSRDTKEWNEAKQTLTKFTMKPRSGLLLPEGYEFAIQVVNNQMPDAIPYLRMQDEGMYKAMGLSFYTQGKGDNSSGTYTQSNVLSEAGYRHIDKLLTQFTGYINAYLIPKLVQLNWPEVRNFPTLQIG